MYALSNTVDMRRNQKLDEMIALCDKRSLALLTLKAFKLKSMASSMMMKRSQGK
jgi:hypothetical protein